MQESPHGLLFEPHTLQQDRAAGAGLVGTGCGVGTGIMVDAGLGVFVGVGSGGIDRATDTERTPRTNPP